MHDAAIFNMQRTSRDTKIAGYMTVYITMKVCACPAFATFILIFIIIQVHHVTCTLGLLSHVAPCIKTKDELK